MQTCVTLRNVIYAYVASLGSIFKGRFRAALSSQVLDAINEVLVTTTKSMGDLAAMLGVSFPNGPSLVGQFGFIADMELPEFTTHSKGDPESFRNSREDCIADDGEGERLAGQRGYGSGNLGKRSTIFCFIPTATTARCTAVGSNATDEGDGGVKVSGEHFPFFMEKSTACARGETRQFQHDQTRHGGSGGTSGGR